MSAAFVDTSGVLALLNAGDREHGRAIRAFERLRQRRAVLITTSYVLVETFALVQRRFGLDAVNAVRADVAPLFESEWVGEELHNAGLDLLEARGRRELSLVDAVSFLVMRQHRLTEAFAFDGHFEGEGFGLATG